MFDIEQSVLFVLSKATQRVSDIFREEFKAYGITPPQFILMAILWKTDGLSQHELSKRTGIDRTALGGIVNRLEEAEFVEREPSPEDRCTHLVWLSDKGRFLEPELCDAAHRVRHRIEVQLIPDDYGQLRLLISKLCAMLTPVPRYGP